MRLKSKLGFLALEDFADPEVVDKSTPNAGEPVDDVVPVPEGETADNAEPDAALPAKETPAADSAVDSEVTDVTDDTTTAVVDAVDAVDPDAAAAADVPDAAAAPAAADTDPDAAAADAAVADADATGEPPAGDVVSEGDDPDAEIVEEEMVAVDDNTDKEEDTNEDVEKLTEATESLEVCIAALESAIETGGLNMVGSVLMRNNINTVTKHLKLKPLMIPALEDMESPDAKIQASSSLKDQLVAFIKRIVDAIKGAFDRFAAWAVDTYKRLTNAFVAIERRAERLAAKAKSSEQIEGKIDNKKLIQSLSVYGKPVENLKEYLAKLAQFSKYLNDPGSYKDYLDAIDECEQLLKTPEKSEEIRGKISELLGRFAVDMEKHAVDITKLLRSNNSEGGGKVVTDSVKAFAIPLLGNQELGIIIPDSAEGIARMSSVVGVVKDTTNATSIDPLAQAEAISVCELVAALAKQTRESGDSNKGGVKELMAEIKKRKDTITALTQSLAGKQMEADGADASVRKVLLFINSFFLSMPKLPVHGINKALPRNLITALDYVAASIGAASGEAAAAKPADPKLLK